MNKNIIIALALLAVPVLAVASPEIAVHQAPTKAVPTITVRSQSILRTRVIANEFRVVWPLPTYVVLESVSGPPVRLTLQTSIHTSMALRQGEVVKLKIVPVRGWP